MIEKEKNADEKDLYLFHVVDTSDEVVEIINTFYSKYLLRPNF